MKNKTLDGLFAVATILLGCYILSGALDYGYWKNSRPGAGFFPLIVSIGIISLGIVNTIMAVTGKEKLSSEFDIKDLYKPAAIIIIISIYIWSIQYLGMLLGIGILVLAAGLAIREKRDFTFLIRLAMVAMLFPICSYFLFSYYLGVPLVEGPFGI